jgi:hypothetical protein
VPRREGNRVQLAARQSTAGRACSKEELGREGKDPVKPPDCGEGGKQATVTVSILHASLKAACGRSGQSRCFVVAVQPTSAGHALGQVIACTCLPCQHGNYLALQPVTGRASEQQPATSDYRLETSDQQTRPVQLLPQPLCILFVPAGCVISWRPVWAYGFPTTRRVIRQPVRVSIYICIFIFSVSVCVYASVPVSACSKSAVKCPFSSQSLISDRMSRFPRRYSQVQVLALAPSSLLALAQRGTRILLSSLPAPLEPSRPQD